MSTKLIQNMQQDESTMECPTEDEQINTGLSNDQKLKAISKYVDPIPVKDFTPRDLLQSVNKNKRIMTYQQRKSPLGTHSSAIKE